MDETSKKLVDSEITKTKKEKIGQNKSDEVLQKSRWSASSQKTTHKDSVKVVKKPTEFETYVGSEEIDKMVLESLTEMEMEAKILSEEEQASVLQAQEKFKEEFYKKQLKPTKSDEQICYALRRGPKCPVIGGYLCDCCLRKRVMDRAAKKLKKEQEKALNANKRKNRCKDCGKKKKNKRLLKRQQLKLISKEGPGYNKREIETIYNKEVRQHRYAKVKNASSIRQVLPPGISKGIGDQIAQEESGKRTRQRKRKKVLGTKYASSKRMSQLIFILPKDYKDNELTEHQEATKEAKKIIRYSKKFWKVKLDKRNSHIPVVFRTLGRLEHDKPSDAWMTRRAREKMADYSGFWSNIRNPYLDLGKPELEMASLYFNNLPPELKIKSSRWYNLHEKMKEEEDRKAANLPSLRTRRIRKPIHVRGKVSHGIGGGKEIDEFVRTAEVFQKRVRGKSSFPQILEEIQIERENSTEKAKNPFGLVKSYRKIPNEEPSTVQNPTTQTRGRSKSKSNKVRGTSTPPLLGGDRTSHREFLHFENMMLALYDLIKILMNITKSQLLSKIPIPSPELKMLRSRSPKPNQLKRPKSLAIIASKLMYLSSKSNLGKSKPSGVASMASFQARSQSMKKSIASMNQDISRTSTPKVRINSTSKSGSSGGNNYKPSKSLSVVTFTRENKTRSGSSRTSTASAGRKSRPSLRMKRLSSKKSLKDIIDRTDFFPSYLKKQMEENLRTYEKVFEKKNKEKRPHWQILSETKNIEKILGSKRATKILQEMKKPTRGSTSIGGPSYLNKNNAYTKGSNPIPRKEIKLNFNTKSTKKFLQAAMMPTPKSGLSKENVLNFEGQSKMNLCAPFPSASSKKYDNSAITRLYNQAGITVTDKEMYESINRCKRPFWQDEEKLKFYYLNEMEKMEADGKKRYMIKMSSIEPYTIYQSSMLQMRLANKMERISDKYEAANFNLTFKKPVRWFRILYSRYDDMGAAKHHGCTFILNRIKKYCDIDVNSRKNMVARLCLTVLSIEPSELGTRYCQEAIHFVLTEILGANSDLIYLWLHERGLPALINI